MASPNVTLTKTASAPTVNVGQEFTFTIQIEVLNTSTSGTLEDIWPVGLEFVSATPAPDTPPVGPNPTWTLGTINPGTPFIVTITAKGLVAGGYINSANVTVSNVSGDSTDSDSVVVAVNGSSTRGIKFY